MHKRPSLFLFVFLSSFLLYCVQDMGRPMVQHILDGGLHVDLWSGTDQGASQDHGFASDASAQSGGGASCGCVPDRTVLFDGPHNLVATQGFGGCQAVYDIGAYSKVVVQGSTGFFISQGHGKAGHAYLLNTSESPHVVVDPTNGTSLQVRANECVPGSWNLTIVGYK